MAVWFAPLLGAAACGSATAPPAALVTPSATTGPPQALGVGRPFFHPDEQMSWEVRVHGILVGEASLAVGQPGEIDGRPAVLVTSRVESAGLVGLVKQVRDQVTTAIDIERSAPLRVDGDLTFGDKHVVVSTHFDASGYQLDVSRDGAPPIHRYQRMPAGQPVYDSHSVMSRLRGWDAEPGTQAYFYVVGGRFLWRNMVQLSARETVRTVLGTFPALRFDGVATRVTDGLAVALGKKPRSYTVWMSDDEDRVPLRVVAHTELGDLEVELVHYQRPARRLAAR